MFYNMWPLEVIMVNQKSTTYMVKSLSHVNISFDYMNKSIIFAYIFLTLLMFSLFVLGFQLTALAIALALMFFEKPGSKHLRVPTNEIDQVKIINVCGIFLMKYKCRFFFEFKCMWNISNAINNYLVRSNK